MLHNMLQLVWHAIIMVAQSLDTITVVGEKDWNGLASIMGCKFKGCGQELTFNTSTKATGLTGKFFGPMI